ATLADFDAVEINPRDPSTTEPSSYDESLRCDLSVRHVASLPEAGGPGVLVRAEQERHCCAAAIVPFEPSARSLCDDRQGPANTWTNLSSTRPSIGPPS